MFWPGPVPYYSSFAYIDYVVPAVPVYYSRARWLEFLPPVFENWLDMDSQLRITKRLEASRSRRRYLDDFPALWKKWSKSDIQNEDKKLPQSLLEELYERSDHNDDWRQTVDIIIEELEDQSWLWYEETKELEMIKKGRKHLTDYAQSYRDNCSKTTTVIRKKEQPPVREKPANAHASVEQTTTTTKTVKGKSTSRRPDPIEEKSEFEGSDHKTKSKKGKRSKSKTGKSRTKKQESSSSSEQEESESEESDHRNKSKNTKPGKGSKSNKDKSKSKKSASDKRADKGLKGEKDTRGKGKSRKQEKSEEEEQEDSDSEPEFATSEPDSDVSEHTVPARGKLIRNGAHDKVAGFNNDYASSSDFEGLVMSTETVTKKTVTSGASGRKNYGSGYYK
ncbi:hypothetical protein E8E11_011965 [Didymella keratinophila]|nr:hypothetical protein E8E11_011965 [Didymella keratinophila]